MYNIYLYSCYQIVVFFLELGDLGEGKAPLDSHVFVMSINDVIMEVKRVKPRLKIDKNMLLNKGRKLCIFQNLLLLIYGPKIRENLRVNGPRFTFHYSLESRDFNSCRGSYNLFTRDCQN